MSLPVRAEALASSVAQGGVPVATIDNVGAELHRILNSIQAIAYFVEMTLPFSELPSLGYLRKLQELVDEGHESLHALVHVGTAPKNLVSEASETDPDCEICVESAGGALS